MKVVLVTGTRRPTRAGEVVSYLDKHKPDIIIVGCARGVDAEARTWANTHGITALVGQAPWLGAGRAAGMQRNGVMVKVARAFARDGADVTVAAFPDSESVGTRDCMRRAAIENLTVVTP
jgi:hypothetical protein